MIKERLVDKCFLYIPIDLVKEINKLKNEKNKVLLGLNNTLSSPSWSVIFQIQKISSQIFFIPAPVYDLPCAQRFRFYETKHTLKTVHLHKVWKTRNFALWGVDTKSWNADIENVGDFGKAWVMRLDWRKKIDKYDKWVGSKK